VSKEYVTFEPSGIEKCNGGYRVQFRGGSRPTDIIFKEETLRKIAKMFADETREK